MARGWIGAARTQLRPASLAACSAPRPSCSSASSVMWLAPTEATPTLTVLLTPPFCQRSVWPATRSRMRSATSRAPIGSVLGRNTTSASVP